MGTTAKQAIQMRTYRCSQTFKPDDQVPHLLPVAYLALTPRQHRMNAKIPHESLRRLGEVRLQARQTAPSRHVRNFCLAHRQELGDLAARVAQIQARSCSFGQQFSDYVEDTQSPVTWTVGRQ